MSSYKEATQTDFTLKACQADILQLKQKVMQYPQLTENEIHDFKYDLVNLYIFLNAAQAIDDHLNVRYTGILEIDYFLTGLKEVCYQAEEYYSMRNLVPPLLILNWLYENDIPKYIKTLGNKGYPTDITFYTTEDFSDYIGYLIRTGGHEMYEAAGLLLNDFVSFAEKNGYFLIADVNQKDSFVRAYKTIKKQIKENGIYNKDFDCIPNYLGVLGEEEFLPLSDNALFIKHLIKLKYAIELEKAPKVHTWEDNTQSFDDPIYFARLLANAKNELEMRGLASDILNFFFDLGCIGEISYGANSIYQHFLTYSPFDKLAFIMIEENLWGYLSNCKDESYEVVSNVVDDRLCEEETLRRIDFHSIKNKVRTVFGI